MLLAVAQSRRLPHALFVSHVMSHVVNHVMSHLMSHLMHHMMSHSQAHQKLFRQEESGAGEAGEDASSQVSLLITSN